MLINLYDNPRKLYKYYPLSKEYAVKLADDEKGTDILMFTQGGTQDKLQGQIFDMIKENPQISTSEIATKLGIGVRTVKRRIKQMTNIVYVGSGYSGHWEIKE